MDLTPGVGLATALLDGAGFFCEKYKDNKPKKNHMGRNK